MKVTKLNDLDRSHKMIPKQKYSRLNNYKSQRNLKNTSKPLILRGQNLQLQENSKIFDFGDQVSSIRSPTSSSNSFKLRLSPKDFTLVSTPKGMLRTFYNAQSIDDILEYHNSFKLLKKTKKKATNNDSKIEDTKLNNYKRQKSVKKDEDPSKSLKNLKESMIKHRNSVETSFNSDSRFFPTKDEFSNTSLSKNDPKIKSNKTNSLQLNDIIETRRKSFSTSKSQNISGLLKQPKFSFTNYSSNIRPKDDISDIEKLLKGRNLE